MLYVGICDDRKEHREQIRDMVCKAVFRFDEVSFSCYESGEQVIEAVDQGSFSCELLLLDIHMAGKDGLETASYIRQHGVDVDIVFVTVSPDYVFDGYTYRAFSYLLKPIDEDRFEDELERYISLKRKQSRCLHVNIGGKGVQIFLDRVRYFGADGRKILVYQRGEEEVLSFYAKMNDLQETLKDEPFLRCHQSFLVNTNYVESWSRTEIDLGGEAIPVSRRYIEAVRQWFAESSDGMRVNSEAGEEEPA